MAKLKATKPPKRRGKRKLYNVHVTDEHVEKALRATGGIYRYAAEKLRCAPNTVKNRVLASEHLQQVIKDIEDDVGDLVRHKFLQKIGKGNLVAMIFYAKCKMHWTERHEITGPNGGPIELRSVLDLRKRMAANVEPDEQDKKLPE